MKAKLLKKLRKESKKLKLIRDEAYQYIVTDNPHNIFEPKLDTYYSVYSTVVIHLYLTTLLLNGFINVDVIGFYPRLVKYVYGHANLELEYIKSNCFTKSY